MTFKMFGTMPNSQRAGERKNKSIENFIIME